MSVMSPWSMTASCSVIWTCHCQGGERGEYGGWCTCQLYGPCASKGDAYVGKLSRLGTLMTTAARCLRKAWIKTHPMTQISMRMSYWGQSPTSLFPGDIQMTPSPSSFPQGRMTCNHLKREELAQHYEKVG